MKLEIVADFVENCLRALLVLHITFSKSESNQNNCHKFFIIIYGKFLNNFWAYLKLCTCFIRNYFQNKLVTYNFLVINCVISTDLESIK